VRILALLLVLVLSASGWCGYYSVAYTSSGTAVSPTQTVQYGPDLTYGFGGSVSWAPNKTDPPGVLTCSGSITATFTWVPDDAEDEPPPFAIVQKRSLASWRGSPGACANSMSAPALPTSGSPLRGQTSDSSMYVVKSAENVNMASFQEVFTPSSTANCDPATVPIRPLPCLSVSWHTALS